ncbi:helix-turn-helix transcriptional regulator [Slackia sp.]|uniref:helix-turn-helix domain-containing protein n=1 Tax=Slackia sp. TaxID=2049041 RepID=UPI0031F2E322
MHPHAFAARQIENIRCERGISVAELARRVHVDNKRLWYILNAQREMRVEEFLRLCIALKVDPRSFVTRDMIDEIAEATARSISRVRR